MDRDSLNSTIPEGIAQASATSPLCNILTPVICAHIWALSTTLKGFVQLSDVATPAEHMQGILEVIGSFSFGRIRVWVLANSRGLRWECFETHET